jgi:N-acetylneuraminic acid mutarotase
VAWPMQRVGKIGSRLYFSGGLRGGEGLYSSELHAYDYGADRMIGKAFMPKFTGDGVTGVINGKLYVAGGFNGLHPVANLDVYDPATNSWTTLAPIPTAGRAAGAAMTRSFG